MATKPKFSLQSKVEQISNIEKATRATEIIPSEAPESTRKRPGKKHRTIPRVNGMTIFLDTELRYRLNEHAHLLEKIDKADFIRVALREFFDKHTNRETGMLDDEAISAIRSYVIETSD